MKKRLALFAVLLAVTTAAWTHEGHVHHILGTVQEVEGNTAVVELRDGKRHTVEFTAKTRFTKGSKEASLADVRPGVRVSVDLADDSRTARSVKIGAAAK
ncbi:MAG TPA: hypothetical protein VNA04_15270 [Thermoanaerobaculia bacterium]|nr:hypothetical protein [Thermoanaerobaculia bacterium]